MFKSVTILLCLLIPLLSFGKGGNSLQFITNKGQVTDQYHQPRTDIDAKIEQGGVTMFVGSGQLHYQWVKNTDPSLTLPQGERTNNIPLSPLEGGNKLAREGEVIIYRMDVVLVGANKNAEVIFEEPTGYHENYYTEYTGEAGVQAKGYQKVTYKDIWPGIDWVLYINPKRQNPNDKIYMPEATNDSPSPLGVSLSRTHSGGPGDEGIIKYDFIVHPGADVSDIQLRYEGATELAIKDGALIATTPFGNITEAAPYSYVAEGGEAITTRYMLEGDVLSFTTADYEGTLVIDPQLVWATYYGGSNSNEANDGGSCVETDLFENVYLAAETEATSNIATSGTHQSTLAGLGDAFLVKFDSSGKRVWGTYFGLSTGGEVFKAIACDQYGNIYGVGGCDSCSGLATSGAHQTNYNRNTKNYSYINSNEAFFVKFDSSGKRIWSTLYGGNGHDICQAVACDGQNNIYIGGSTTSDTGIATSGTHKSSYNTSSTPSVVDGFIVKFDSSGQRLWGTYYGGDSSSNGHNDYVNSLACDRYGYLYIGGTTRSNNGIATSGAHQDTVGNSSFLSYDGYLAKIDGNTGKRIWGSYYGGIGDDYIRSIVTDDSNHIYIVGATHSPTGIATNNGVYKSFKWPFSGGYVSEVFLVKFDSNGQRLWGTYYGGKNPQYPTGLTIGIDNYLYIMGVTFSTANMTTFNSHQSTHGGGSSDNFMAVFTPAAQLYYATYYGGSKAEYNITGGGKLLGDVTSDAIAASNSGKVYIGALTLSTNNIATQGSHQDSLTLNGPDAYLAAFDIDTVVYIPQVYTDTSWCPGDTVRIVYGVNMPFHSGNSFTVQLSDSNGNFANGVSIGTRTDSVSDTITCVVPLGTPAAKGYRIRILADSPNRASWDNQWDIRIKETPASLQQTTNTPVCTRDSLHLTGTTTTTGAINWVWSGPNSFASSQKDTFIVNAQLSDSGRYILTATLNSTGCSLSDTVDVEMRPTPDTPSASSNSPVCETFALNLTTSTTTNGVSWNWSGPGSYNSTTQNPTVTSSVSSTHAGNYIATATLNGCSSTDTVTVVVLPKPAKPTASATNSPLCQFQDLQLTANNIIGASYNWYGPSLFTATTQNPTRYNMTFTDSGYYYVYATVSGCKSDTDSVRVVVNTDPVVNIFPSPGTTICKGEEVTFTAVPTNAGTATYGWSVNYITTGTTGTVYKTSTLNNGDVVRCEMISTGTCATAYTDTSNGITMTVNDVKAPSVTISANPNTSLYPNEPVTFTASPTNGGNNPTYQWLRNGSPISGAQSAVWGANANFLSDGDDICVVLFSDHVCPEPDTALSNCIKVDIRLSVATIAGNSNINIYPNPVTNELYIEGIDNGTIIELYDVVGKKIHHATTSNNKYSINMSSYATGNYLLKMKFNDGRETQSKIVK